MTEWRHYIVANGEMVAVVSRKNPATETTWYLLKDHLGSVAKILSSGGTEFVSESFAAFGARRDPATWSGPCPCPDLDKIRSVTRRGFTEHEMVGGQSMGLIHMNGRVKDSITGRFLSADPYVQAPFNSQSLNRYSYVFNNPLSNVDPTGFLCWYSYITDSDGSLIQGERHCDHPEAPAPGGGRYETDGEPGAGGGGGYRAASNTTSTGTGNCTASPTTAQPQDPATPWTLGWEWLTGNGPRHHSFRDGDSFTELLRSHQNIQRLVENARNGTVPAQGQWDYSVGGWDGVGLYLHDYSNLLTGGRTGNLAVT